jgi:N-acetylmuramic acid 6-phosphate (MurNAc-6-P) etherase
MTGLGRVLGNEMLCVQATNAKLKDRQVRILRRQVSSLDAESAVELLQSTAWDLRCALLIAHGWAPDAASDALQSDVPFRDLLR